MNQIKRAIIMAAGKGTRLRPITYETAKSLVEVNGKPMIETIIDALHENGIDEIHVVVGYKKEQFEALSRRHEGIHLIENPHYEDANNISSLYAAREFIYDTFIIDGDQLIYDPKILEPLFERSGYCAAWTQETEEWLLKVQEDVIVSCSREGGRDGYRLYSVSMWSEKDGEQLKRHLETEFIEKNNRDIYWDDIALFCYPEDYQLGIRAIRPEAVREVDTIAELLELDPSYQNFKGL